MICSVERSGSTFYSALLEQTELVGRPVTEPFNDRVETAAFRRHQFEDYGGYLEFVKRMASTSNGVYGINLMWRHLARIDRILRNVPTWSDQTSLGMLRHYLADLGSFVFTYRRDQLAQAASWAIAYQTDRWRSTDPDLGRMPSYHFALMDALYQNVLADTFAWETWFVLHAIEPLRIAYEDLIADPQAEVIRTFDFLGVRPPTDFELTCEFKNQGSSLNREWCERYTMEVSQYSTTLPLPKHWIGS